MVQRNYSPLRPQKHAVAWSESRHKRANGATSEMRATYHQSTEDHSGARIVME